MTIGGTTSRTWTSHLSDPDGLGRWTSARCGGKGQRFGTVVSEHGPHKATSPGSAGAQHEAHLAQQGDPGLAQQAFLQDLASFVHDRQKEGDMTVTGIDANENVSHGTAAQEAVHEPHLHQPVMESFGPDLPNTCAAGSEPIDAMLMSNELRIESTGCLAFSDCHFSDHRVSWMDFDTKSLFGDRMPAVVTPPARRLKLHDPSVVDQFLQHCKSFPDLHQLPRRLAELRDRPLLMTSEQREQACDQLDTLWVRGILRAEQLC